MSFEAFCLPSFLKCRLENYRHGRWWCCVCSHLLQSFQIGMQLSHPISSHNSWPLQWLPDVLSECLTIPGFSTATLALRRGDLPVQIYHGSMGTSPDGSMIYSNCNGMGKFWIWYVQFIYSTYSILYNAYIYSIAMLERTHIFLEGLITYLLAHCYGFWLDLPLMQQTAVQLLKVGRCFPFFGTSCNVCN